MDDLKRNLIVLISLAEAGHSLSGETVENTLKDALYEIERLRRALNRLDVHLDQDFPSSKLEN